MVPAPWTPTPSARTAPAVARTDGQVPATGQEQSSVSEMSVKICSNETPTASMPARSPSTSRTSASAST